VNSLRPLVTISLLGIICLVLYMKINESEPVVPADALEWDMSGDLNIGEADIANNPEFGELEIGDATTAAAPQTSAEPSTTTSAPAFGGTASAAPAATTMNEEPPAFQPNTTTAAAPFAAVPEPSADIEIDATTETPIAAVTPQAESSKLPPLPALPAVAVGAAAVANEALTDSSPTAKPETTTPSATSSPSTTPENAALAPSFTNQEPAATTESLEAEPKGTPSQASLFSATRLAVQSALDRGELSQALLLLSDWYGDPSLSPEEATEVQQLLGQLAGSVIYSTEHRLEPPYMVQAGEKLEDIAQKYNIPWQLLAKINGITGPEQLKPGQQLKVVRGPFSARIDLSDRKMVVMLDRRYAGQFSLDIEPTTSIEEGYWAVNQKLLTPGNIGAFNASAGSSNEERSILLTNTASAAGQVTVLRGPGSTTPTATDTAGRVIQFRGADVNDVYDILSLGSQVMIRR
jgi:LysM repeat protein